MVSGSNSLYADLETGLFDSSGVRFYVSDQLRQHEVGMLQIGGKSPSLSYPFPRAYDISPFSCIVFGTDPFISLFGEPIGDGLSRHTFECPASCSQLALVDEPVTVLREHLHMHKTGKGETTL